MINHWITKRFGLENDAPEENEEKSFSNYQPEIEKKPSEEGVSIRGRVVADLMRHFTNDLAIGKKIKTGELRKRMQEPPWKVPSCFTFTHIAVGIVHRITDISILQKIHQLIDCHNCTIVL